MTLSLEGYLHGSHEPYTQYSHAKCELMLFGSNSVPQWSRFQVNRYDSKGYERCCWLFSVLVSFLFLQTAAKQNEKKNKLHSLFYIDSVTLIQKIHSQFLKMLQPNVLTVHYLIWNQEEQKDSAAQDRSTGGMNTIGDIIFSVLNITSPCLNITSLAGDGS